MEEMDESLDRFKLKLYVTTNCFVSVWQVWQYITLMRRLFLIDCPGVVYPSDDSETDIVLKGVVRWPGLSKSTVLILQSQRPLHPLILYMLLLGPSGEDPNSGGSHRSGAGEGQSGVHSEDIPHSILELRRRLPGKARLSHRKTA